MAKNTVQGNQPGGFNTTGMYAGNPSGVQRPGVMYPNMPVRQVGTGPAPLQGQPFNRPAWRVPPPNPGPNPTPTTTGGNPMPDFGANPTGGLSPSQQALLQLMMMYSNPNRTPTSNG